MDQDQYMVLCVDDEENILNSLKRLLRKESYRLLTANSGQEGLKLLEENDVHLVISDQRMPEMSGTDFMAKVKTEHPDTMRIILTGYTDVDSITESINKGHVYKFLLKPWNDQNLKLEINQALEQYELVQANKRLHEQVLQQNEELTKMNENLEFLVKERTKDLKVQHQALELSQTILEDLSIPIIGVGVEGMIVLMNREAQSLYAIGNGFGIGDSMQNYFSSEVTKKMTEALTKNLAQTIKGYQLSDTAFDIDLTPLSGKFSGKGLVITFKPSGRSSS